MEIDGVFDGKTMRVVHEAMLSGSAGPGENRTCR
jgi:hypothetical protein